eukprot:7383009-Prymnesium_polylepis.2
MRLGAETAEIGMVRWLFPSPPVKRCPSPPSTSKGKLVCLHPPLSRRYVLEVRCPGAGVHQLARRGLPRVLRHCSPVTCHVVSPAFAEGTPGGIAARPARQEACSTQGSAGKRRAGASGTRQDR